MDDPFKQVADALQNHQVTDEEGAIMPETTDIETTTAQEENTIEEVASSETSAETESTAPKAEDDGTEPNSAIDEIGRRYVPEKRFKEVYAKQKELERELEKAKAQPSVVTPQVPNQQPSVGVDKSTALELELLKTTLPQFNPDSAEYDSELDRLGAQIYNANPGITMIEAGRRALATAKALTRKQAQVVAEARAVKSEQSDQGTTGRARSKGQVETPDVKKMTLDEMEEWLKSNGQW